MQVRFFSERERETERERERERESERERERNEIFLNFLVVIFFNYKEIVERTQPAFR